MRVRNIIDYIDSCGNHSVSYNDLEENKKMLLSNARYRSGGKLVHAGPIDCTRTHSTLPSVDGGLFILARYCRVGFEH